MFPILIPVMWLLTGVCVHAGMSHILVGLRRPRSYTYVLFGFQCLLSAASTISIARLYDAQTAADYLHISRSANTFVIVFFICMPWLVAGSTSVRPLWPAWLLSAIYLLVMIAELLLPYGMLFADEPSLRRIQLPWGEQVTAQAGDPTPLLNIFWCAHVLLFGYVLWACSRQYHRGQRRQALTLLLSVVPFALTLGINILINFGLMHFIFLGAFGFVAMVLLMSWGMSRELHQNRERSQAILDTVPSVIWIKDLEGRYVFVNRHFERMFGRASEDILDRTDHDLFPAALADSWRNSDRRVLQSNDDADAEEEIAIGDARRTMLALRFPLRDSRGKPYALGGVSTDVTDSKRISDAMRGLAQSANAQEGDEFFRDCVQQLAKTYGADHAFIAICRDGSESLQGIATWPCENLWLMERIPVHGTICGQVLQEGRVLVERNARRRYPGDRQIESMQAESVLVAPLISTSRRTLGVIGVASSGRLEVFSTAADLMEVFARRVASEMDRLAAVDALRALAAQLEHRVSERTRELEAFSYSVSHDLRTPLRAIDGYSSLVLEAMAGSNDAMSKEYLRRTRKAVERMSELIDDLLELAKVTRQELRTERIDLSAMVSQAVARLMEGEPTRQAEIYVAPEMKTFGDSRLLNVVVDNLLGNAWKYTGRTPHTRIDVGALNVDGSRAFFVKDNGVGFDPAYSDKLFQVFERLHEPSSFSGTGVGLAIVARIIQRHGGKVWGEGVPGKGATFYFTLPEHERMDTALGVE